MELSVLELKELIDRGEVTLVDVREPHEVEVCKIKGSVFIPMREISNQINKLDVEKEHAITCHSGVRSLHVVNYLIAHGYQALNVSGGIDMWASIVDKDMKRY